MGKAHSREFWKQCLVGTSDVWMPSASAKGTQRAPAVQIHEPDVRFGRPNHDRYEMAGNLNLCQSETSGLSRRIPTDYSRGHSPLQCLSINLPISENTGRLYREDGESDVTNVPAGMHTRVSRGTTPRSRPKRSSSRWRRQQEEKTLKHLTRAPGRPKRRSARGTWEQSRMKRFANR